MLLHSLTSCRWDGAGDPRAACKPGLATTERPGRTGGDPPRGSWNLAQGPPAPRTQLPLSCLGREGMPLPAHPPEPTWCWEEGRVPPRPWLQGGRWEKEEDLRASTSQRGAQWCHPAVLLPDPRPWPSHSEARPPASDPPAGTHPCLAWQAKTWADTAVRSVDTLGTQAHVPTLVAVGALRQGWASGRPHRPLPCPAWPRSQPRPSPPRQWLPCNRDRMAEEPPAASLPAPGSASPPRAGGGEGCSANGYWLLQAHLPLCSSDRPGKGARRGSRHPGEVGEEGSGDRTGPGPGP